VTDEPPIERDDWIKKPDDRDGEEAREVYALAGLALYAANLLEHEIVNLLVGLSRMERLKSGRTTTNLTEEIDKVWDDNFRLTLGGLITRIKSAVPVSDDLKAGLEKTLEERNRLAHRFFREHDLNFVSAAGRRQMAEELTEMRELFCSTDKGLQPITSAIWRKSGISPELRDWLAERSLELARSGVSETEIDRIVGDEIAAKISKLKS